MYCTALIVVRDVAASAKWYQQVVGVTSGHGGDEFEMLMSDGRMLLMLHHADADEHPALAAPGEGPPGSGVLLYFGVDDVRAVYARAQAAGADLIDEPHENPNARAVEFSLRDPDGYALTISEFTG